jgi:hypothetical protein
MFQVTPETKFVALNNPEELQQLRHEDNSMYMWYKQILEKYLCKILYLY